MSKEVNETDNTPKLNKHKVSEFFSVRLYLLEIIFLSHNNISEYLIGCLEKLFVKIPCWIQECIREGTLIIYKGVKICKKLFYLLTLWQLILISTQCQHTLLWETFSWWETCNLVLQHVNRQQARETTRIRQTDMQYLALHTPCLYPSYIHQEVCLSVEAGLTDTPTGCTCKMMQR